MPVEALLAIFAYFVAGVLLRTFGIADASHARFLFRLVFYVTLPALAFGTIADRQLTADSVALPVAGFLVDLACASLALLYARLAKLDGEVVGTLILGTCIANTVFTFPFVLGVLGPDALADAVIYDIGNAIFVATFAYVIASRYGQAGRKTVLSSLLQMLRTPLFIAIFVAIVFSVAGLAVPAVVHAILAPLGATTSPLILIGLGAAFSTARLRDSVVYGAVLIRMTGGLVAGAACIFGFGFTGATAVAVLALGAAPIGFNAVTLASITGLDTEHAAASLSVSVAIGLVTTTGILAVGHYWLV